MAANAIMEKSSFTIDQIEDAKECIVLFQGLNEQQKIMATGILQGMQLMKDVLMEAPQH